MAGTIHIGELIHSELQRQECTVAWLARHLGVTRAACYRIFKNNSIDTIMLQKISVLLRCDFFELYSEKVAEQLNRK